MARIIERRAQATANVPELLQGTAFMEEAGADTFRITGLPFEPAAVLAHVLRADDVAIAVDGTFADGVAEVTLVADCYHVAGRLGVAIYLTDAEMNSQCVYACVGNVYRTVGGTELDSGTEIPTLAQLEAAYAACVEATEDAESVIGIGVVRYDEEQTLTDAEKTQARENIGVSDITGAVRYDTAQTLTDTQKAQARTNIGAETSGLADRVNALHNLVNYGYDTPFNGNYSSAISGTRNGTHVTVNGSASSSSNPWMLKLNGTPVAKGATNDIKAFADPVALTSGHRYRLRIHPVSGTFTANKTLARVCYAGSATAIGNYYTLGDDMYNDFAYEPEEGVTGVHVGLGASRSSVAVSLSNFVCEVTLQDITDDNRMTVSGSDPEIVAAQGIRYICGEVDSLSFTPSATGICDVRFTSGTTPAVLTVTPPTGMTMLWPDWFDPTSLDASTTYEINIADGVYGAVMAWT